MENITKKHKIKIDHIGYVTNSLEKLIKFHEDLGFNVYPEEDAPNMNQKMQIIEKDGVKIEFLAPYTSPPPQSLGAQHFAYSCSGIEELLATFEKNGYKAVVPVSKYKDRKFFFIRDPQGVYVEFMEYEK